MGSTPLTVNRFELPIERAFTVTRRVTPWSVRLPVRVIVVPLASEAAPVPTSEEVVGDDADDG